MADAYIVDAVRSPTGKRRGGLAEVHGADLGAHVLRAIVERNGIPDVDYDDVMFGCLDAIGPLAGDIARTCWLAAGLSDEVPGTTIDRQCGSSQQAVHFAAQAVMAGVNDVVIAGGVQTMSKIPISAAMIAGLMLSIAVGMYPNLLVSTLDPQYNLTIYNAASAPNTLTVMLVFALVGMPFVLLYTAGVYYVFRGRVQLGPESY